MSTFVYITAEQTRDVLALIDRIREEWVSGATIGPRLDADASQAEIDDALIAARMTWDQDNPHLAALRRSKEARRAARAITHHQGEEVSR